MSSQLSQTIEIRIDPDLLENASKNVTEMIAYAMAGIFTMNVFDAVATIYWVLAGYATEANPLMDILLSVHPVLFVTVKLSLIALGIAILWIRRCHWMSRLGVAGIFAIYAALSCYHVGAIGTLLI